MAIPEGKSEPPYLIPQKRVASTPDSGPIPKKPNNTTRMTRRRPEEKVEGSLDLENSKPTEDLTTDEVFGRLEAVRTDMATISWHMGLPKKLNIPEILLDFSIPNMPEWPDQHTIDTWLAQKHRKPDEDKNDKQDEGPEYKKNERNEEAKDEKPKDEPTKDDYEDAMQKCN